MSYAIPLHPVLGWWERFHDMLKAIDEYIRAGEADGEPLWKIELDDQAAWPLADARLRASL